MSKNSRATSGLSRRTFCHAPTQTSGAPDYTALETFQLTRPRRDRFFGRLGNHEKAAAGSGSR
jgi:hypothetical protein